MKNIVIKIGAYLVLIIGIVLALGLLAFVFYEFIVYPLASIQKKALVATIALIVLAVILLVSIAIFEALIDMTQIESEILDLEYESDLLKGKK